MTRSHREQVDALRETLFAKVGYAFCAVCRIDDKRVLEFHHLDRTKKLGGQLEELAEIPEVSHRVRQSADLMRELSRHRNIRIRKKLASR